MSRFQNYFTDMQNQEKVSNNTVTKDRVMHGIFSDSIITDHTSSVSLHYLVKCQVS